LPAFPLLMLLVFALTLFCSATLLFMVQPLAGKMILPLLGGSPEVWNTCMVFFQAMLLGGYAYAHASTKYLGVRKQAALHLILLLIPFLFLPISVNKGLVHAGVSPISSVMLVLLFSVGVPFFVISTSAPMLQRWFSSTDHPAARDPYFLYGASNLGSMLALISYPLLVEPLLKLGQQTWVFAVGYGLLVLLIGGCAFLLWRAAPAVQAAAEGTSGGPAAPPSGPVPPVTAPSRPEAIARSARGRKNDPRIKETPADKPAAVTANESEPASDRRISWARRLRWVLLAAIPSSLMLGATTYITTDIAPIPLLWVLPLGLYLLSFIIVFAKVSQLVQSVVVSLEALVVLFVGMTRIYPLLQDSDLGNKLFWVIALGLFAGSIAILFVRDRNLNHKAMILALPLLILLVLFMMLTDIRPGITDIIALHLLALFVVAMVCHGELANDRPAAAHLTEFFLLMSVGGVLGGLFNAMLAPLVFNSLAEYPLAMLLACLLLPHLSREQPTTAGRYIDLSLAGVYLLVGITLIALRLGMPAPKKELTATTLGDFSNWGWSLAGLVLAGLGGIYLVLRGWSTAEPLAERRARLFSTGGPLLLLLGGVVMIGLQFWQLLDWGKLTADPLSRRMAWLLLLAGPVAGVAGGVLLICSNWRKSEELWARILDVLLPLSLMVLVVGLIFGCHARPIDDLVRYATELDAKTGAAPWIPFKSDRLRMIIMFGLPAILCYTCVERSVRFGLCVGAILLAGSFSDLFVEEGFLLQKRSYFGVLVVERRAPFHRLLHGTTLHGEQFSSDTLEGIEAIRSYLGPMEKGESLRRLPLAYYHRAGPIGQFMAAYNTPESKPHVGVIGLGTGTLAAYCQPGQKFTFYDIDPLVVEIATKSDKYFTFWKDAKARGAELKILLNDARLEIEKQVAENEAIQTENAKRKENGEQPLELPHEKYGIMVIDAFSSDAIPIHLITREAIRLYMKMVREDGILTFHISNRYMDLRPVLENLAEAEGLHLYCYTDEKEQYLGKAGSTWAVIARDKAYMSRLLTRDKLAKEKENWKLTAEAFLALPDTGNRFTPFSCALQCAVNDNRAPWTTGGPEPEDFRIPSNYRREVREYNDLKKKIGVWSDDYSNVISVFIATQKEKFQ